LSHFHYISVFSRPFQSNAKGKKKRLFAKIFLEIILAPGVDPQSQVDLKAKLFITGHALHGGL
jgi:hypothetical protein